MYNMESERIFELMTRQIGRLATDDDMQELSALLSKNPDYAYLNEILVSLQAMPCHFEKNIPRDELVHHGWQFLKAKLIEESDEEIKTVGERNRVRFGRLVSFRKQWMAAVIIFILFAGGSVYYFGPSRVSLERQAVVKSKIADTHFGATAELVLADGTNVWLNAGSRLIYPDVFSKTNREVTLIGEAFFEVTKDADAPFLVHAGGLTVRVLGTRFNVKAYREDEEIETTLISGKVQVVLNDDPGKEITLSPYEKLTFVNQVTVNTAANSMRPIRNELRYKVQALPVNAGNILEETAWLDRKLIISNESFDGVARLLERKYDVHFYFEGEKWKRERMSGVFEKENIQQVLDILKMTTRFNYRLEGNSIYIF